MKPFIAFVIGLVLGVGLWLFIPSSAPEIKYVTQYRDRVVETEVRVDKDCAAPPEKHCLSPAYVLGLLQDCRAGKLDQSIPDITVRK